MKNAAEILSRNVTLCDQEKHNAYEGHSKKYATKEA